MNTRWPLFISILPGEAISSWLIRVALAHGCDPLVLTGVLWPKSRFWTTDPDRWIGFEELKILSEYSGINAAEIEGAMLRATAERVCINLRRQSVWPWILALGTRNRKRCGGWQFCPECLAADEQPYFRLRWRFAWHTSCSSHNCTLLDSCPHCLAPIMPHLLVAQDSLLSICPICRQKISKSSSAATSVDLLRFQAMADLCVTEKSGNHFDSNISTAEWFGVCRYMVSIVRRASIGIFKGLRAFLKNLNIDILHVLPTSTGLPLEMLPSNERVMLLKATAKLLEVNAEAFLAAAQEASLSVRSFNSGATPRNIQTVITQLRESDYTRSRTRRPSSYNPRSELAVKRMWARLKRRQDRSKQDEHIRNIS